MTQGDRHVLVLDKKLAVKRVFIGGKKISAPKRARP